MKRKRPALLLELLIAMTLLALGLVGLIKSPVYLHRAQMRQFEHAEADRAAAWAFTELREQLVRAQVSWEKIPQLKESTQLTPDITLTTLEEKRAPNGKVFRLVAVCIRIKGHDFTYRVTVEKAC